MRTSTAILVTALPLLGCSGGDDGPARDAGGAVDGSVTDAPVCAPADPSAALEPMRQACAFAAGARVEQTLGTDAAYRAAIPITHVVVVMQENRSFDHYFATLPDTHPDVERIPEAYGSYDLAGETVRPFHLDSTCLEDDPPHQWIPMHIAWNGGAMDGFVDAAAVRGSNGHYAMGTYDETDLPFYHWLARTFALSDRYFGSVLGGTWSNRDYLYAASSYGVRDTGERAITEARTIFDALDDAGVEWGSYTDGNPRQDCLGWDGAHEGVHDFDALLAALADGSLPPVAFADPGPGQDEHPAADVQPGEVWTRSIYEAARASPLWPRLVVFHTYDESGGLFDHVPPPAACLPSADQAEFDRLGIRVPFIAISPWARRGHVSHRDASHTDVLRFIELVHDLPALTARDANSGALLDLFDFACGSVAPGPEAPAAGTGGCPPGP
jgi:phospholipase C